MLKYFLIATVVVMTIVVGVTAFENRELIRIRIEGGKGNVAPKPAPTIDFTHRSPGPWTGGDTPWILSALPECLRQVSESSGPEAYVRAHLPKDARPVVPPATLNYGPCTISVTDGEAYVTRGNDRFHIPAPSQFYTTGRGLALVRETASYVELRLYRPPTTKI